MLFLDAQAPPPESGVVQRSGSGQQRELALEAPPAKFWPRGPWQRVGGYTVAPHKWGRHRKGGTRAGYTVKGHERRIGRDVYGGRGGPASAARSAIRWGRVPLPVPEYPTHPIPAGSASHQDPYIVRNREENRRNRKWNARWNAPPESGLIWAAALPVLGKLVVDGVVTLALWLGISWAVSELEETEAEVSGQVGAPGSAQAQISGVDAPMSASVRAMHRAQVGALEARGEAMLSGPRLTIYRALIADTVGLLATPSATSRAASSVRALLFRYTLKNGDCDAFPQEREECAAYQERHGGGTSTANVLAGASGAPPGGALPAGAPPGIAAPTSWILPAAALAILGLLIFGRRRKG